jgi:RNA polymerase sigma-70 factor, ECF subfamily
MKVDIAAEIEKHRPMAVKYALRFVSYREDAEDAVQRASLKAFRLAHTFRGDSQWRTWFCSIVRREALMMLRHDKAKIVANSISMTDVGEQLFPLPHTVTPERIVMVDEKFELIQGFLDRLRPKLKAAMVAVIDGAGGREFNGSEILNSPGLKANIHRARLKMKEMVQAKGLEEIMRL